MSYWPTGNGCTATWNGRCCRGPYQQLLICSAISGQLPARLMTCLTRMLSLRGMCCRGGGVTHHSILSYQERLYGYLEQLALQQTAAAATLLSGQQAAPRDAEDSASLFRQAPSLRAENPLLDEFGRFAGAQPRPSFLPFSKSAWWCVLH